MDLKLKKNGFHRPGPVVLAVLDGVGISDNTEGNAVADAEVPVFDALMESEIHRLLKAHGTAVGMPTDDDMGNSEVGHNALGAGRIFAQGAKRVNEAIADGSIFQSHTWNKLIDQVNSHNSTLHFLGLLSDGGVHSNINQLIAMIKHAAGQNVKKLRVHALTDGRDVGGRTALLYFDKLQTVLDDINKQNGFDYAVASGGGRMVITMDRYNADWSMVEHGWNTHVHGIADRKFHSAHEAIETFYAEDADRNDQYNPPFVVVDNSGQPLGKIQDNDAVIFFNYRGDRAIEISLAFTADKFDHFDRGVRPKVLYAGMMQYDGDLKLPELFLVDPPKIQHPIGEYFAANELRTMAISETQKFGHVTYFWNGNRSGYINDKLEKYVEIKSDNVPFNQKPAMKAKEITDEVIRAIESGEFDHIRINYPNGDMVGHTGDYDAVKFSLEVTDVQLGRVLEAVKKANGILIVLADHGNADQMWTVDKKTNVKAPHTAHTLASVPFIIYDPNYNNEYSLANVEEPAGLANVAATLCNLCGFEAPKEYNSSLIVFKK
ncbi:MAG: 2,3-bisphosphoglycerate-independent phosphoglycerate mutase [Brevinemataceae bacterium]